jgi:hypothetical protein
VIETMPTPVESSNTTASWSSVYFLAVTARMMHRKRLHQNPFLGLQGPTGRQNLLISVRTANLFGPIPLGRMVSVAGRPVTVLRDKLERETCRAIESILRQR